MRIVGSRERREIRVIGEGLRDVVAERTAGCLRVRATGREFDDKIALEFNLGGAAGFQCAVQQFADGVEDQPAGHVGDDRGFAVLAHHAQRYQAMLLAMTLIGDEALRILRCQQRRDVTSCAALSSR